MSEGVLPVRFRRRLASFGWRYTEVTGSKVSCCLCRQPIPKGETSWNWSPMRIHNKCMAGLFIYGPSVFHTIDKWVIERKKLEELEGAAASDVH